MDEILERRSKHKRELVESAHNKDEERFFDMWYENEYTRAETAARLTWLAFREELLKSVHRRLVESDELRELNEVLSKLWPKYRFFGLKFMCKTLRLDE